MRKENWLFAWKAVLALILVACALSLTGCATSVSPAARLPVQFATMKVIESSDRITAEGVLRYVDLARSVVDRDVVAVADVVLRELDAEGLSPADKLLAQAIILEIQARLQDTGTGDSTLSLLEVLSWVEAAARLSQVGSPGE